ncbi:MAG: hypothetical protein M1816_004062 [Peltula sp. TS41687]|nr:MAG: hypothetical protein M1816_004062 [Peltula sp. TS41687]
MSLVRVTSIDSFSDRATSPTSEPRDRKLSFNPVGEWVPPRPQEELVGAFEVSKTKRLLQVWVAVIYCLLAAGIVFGYAALKPVLISEGVYRDRCTPEEREKHARTCYGQELRLNLMFTIAAVASNVCALPVGTILDRYGPRIAGIIGGLLVALGCITFAFASDLPFDAYISGYLFLSLGGPFVFIPAYQLSNAFPAHSGAILAVLTGAFDSSSAIFLIYRLIYQQSHGHYKLKTFFLIYLIVPTIILLAQIFLMPAESYKTVGEMIQEVEDDGGEFHRFNEEPYSDAHRDHVHEERFGHIDDVATEITELLGSRGGSRHARKEEHKRAISGVWGVLHGRPAWDQIRSPWFVLIALFTVIQMTRINYFVATIRYQYEHLLGDYDQAVRINSFFDVALPVGGIIAIPFIGYILDHTSTLFVLSILITTATTIGVLGLLPYAWAGYANVVLFVFYRPFYYTAVSDYSAKVFGFATFGKVYGLIMCFGGLLNFSQYGLDALTHLAFRNNPIPVNLILLVIALIVGVTLVGYVWRNTLSIKRGLLEEEAEDAREVLMPAATDTL